MQTMSFDISHLMSRPLRTYKGKRATMGTSKPRKLTICVGAPRPSLHRNKSAKAAGCGYLNTMLQKQKKPPTWSGFIHQVPTNPACHAYPESR